MLGRSFVVIAACLGAVTPGFAQGPVSDINSRYAVMAPERRSERILLPALASFEAAPIGADRLDSARLLPFGSPGWDAAERWTTAAPQVAVLDALKQVTEQRRYEQAMVFAQPYGVANLSPDTIETGLYTDLGDPPLLAAAEHLYLPALDRLQLLVHVEATRLVGAGEPAEAVDLLLRLAAFGRQMADRAMMREADWGYEAMVDALRRVRDVVYLDFLGERLMAPDDIRDTVDRLDPEEFIAYSRLGFPTGNQLAARQLIDRVYAERGGVNEPVFLSTMIRLSGGGKPLWRFAEASRWAGVADGQVDWFRINEVLTEVYSGWTGRWNLDPFDPVLQLPFAIETVQNPESIVAVLAPMTFETSDGREMSGSEIFELRTLLDVERIGTRQALGVVGQYYEHNLYPPTLSSIRPRWVRRIESDPYNTNRRIAAATPPLTFFVPVRDDYVANANEDREPHRMQVFPGDGSNFGVTLFADQFVLYSAGRNGAKDFAERVSQDRNALLGDYLIWPPVLGLHRLHLQDLGEFD